MLIQVSGKRQRQHCSKQNWTIPIVFGMSIDPVAQGIVESLARPGGNATGFFATEPSLGGKWLGGLGEIVPGLRRVAVIFNPETSTGGPSYLHSVKRCALVLGPRRPALRFTTLATSNLR